MKRLLRLGITAALVWAAAATGSVRAAEVCGSAIRVPEDQARVLRPYVERLRLRHRQAAMGTISHVHATGRLPDCYLTKREAQDRGWRPGSDLWRVAPGHAIGGDHFGNRERRLPPRHRYVEADLDYAGGRRGAARLVFARGTKGRWLMWVTTDHYTTFHEVPAPR